MKEVKRIAVRLLLAAAVIFGLLQAGRENVKAAEPKVKIHTMGAVLGQKPYGCTRRNSPLSQNDTVWIEDSHYMVLSNYNKDGYTNGVKWFHDGYVDGKYSTTIRMGQDEVFGGKPTFYYVQFYLYNWDKNYEDGKMPLGMDNYRLQWFSDIPDYEVPDGFDEPISLIAYTDGTAEVRFCIPAYLLTRYLEDVTLNIEEPTAGKRIADLKVSIEDKDELKASVKKNIVKNVANSWCRIPAGQYTANSDHSKWEKVSSSDIIEDGYYYATCGLLYITGDYLVAYKKIENHTNPEKPRILDERNLTLSIKSEYTPWNKTGNYISAQSEYSEILVGREIDSVVLNVNGDMPLTAGTVLYDTYFWSAISIDDGHNYTLDTSANIPDNGIYNGIMWYDVTEKRALKKYAADGDKTLTKGHKYQLCVFVKAKTGYSFGPKVDMVLAQGGVLDSEPAVVTGYHATGGASSIMLTYDFTPPSTTRFNVTFPYLRAGDTPSYDPGIESDASYKLYDYNQGNFLNGIEWAYGSQFIDPSDDAILVGGQEYTVLIHLEAKDGEQIPLDPWSLKKRHMDFDFGGIGLENVRYRLLGTDHLEIAGTFSCGHAVTELHFYTPTNIVDGKPMSDVCYFRANDELPNPIMISEYQGYWKDGLYAVPDMKDSWLVSSDGNAGTYASVNSTGTYEGGKYYATTAIGKIKSKIEATFIQYGDNTFIGTGLRGDAKIFVNGEPLMNGGKQVTWNTLSENYTYYYPQLPKDGTDIKYAVVSGVVNKIYTGSALTQDDITVKMDEDTLVEGTDYTVSYRNNIEPSTEEVHATVIITGKGKYKGTIEEAFEIFEPFAAATGIFDFAKAEVSGVADQAYTGSEIKLALTVTYEGRTLAEGTDYTVAYTNNKEVGEATVTLTGTGLYKGSITKKFKITAKDAGQSEQIIPGVGKITVDGATLIDPDGVSYRLAETLKAEELKKGLAVADKATGGKYRITKVVYKKGKFKSGTAEYVGPYNRDNALISIAAKTKIGGNTFTVTGVAANATKGCTKVNRIVIGSNVTTIAKNAFSGCGAKTIQIKSLKLKKVGKNAFKGINKKATIKVPKKKKTAYKKLLKKKGQAKSVKIK